MNSLLERNLVHEKYFASALHIVITSIFDILNAVRQEVFVVPERNIAVADFDFVVFVFGIDWV